VADFSFDYEGRKMKIPLLQCLFSGAGEEKQQYVRRTLYILPRRKKRTFLKRAGGVLSRAEEKGGPDSCCFFTSTGRKKKRKGESSLIGSRRLLHLGGGKEKSANGWSSKYSQGREGTGKKGEKKSYRLFIMSSIVIVQGRRCWLYSSSSG